MRRASGPTVTLFPFLTVLLCASGTLIVLLIALSQHVRDTPPDDMAAEAPTPVAPPEAPPIAAVEPAAPDPAPVEVAPPPPATPVVPAGPPRIVRIPYRGPDPAKPLRRRLAAARQAAADVSASLNAAAAKLTNARTEAVAAREAVTQAGAAVEAARVRLAAAERKRAAGEAAAERAAEEVAEFQAAVAEAKEDDSPRSLLPVIRTADGVTADRPILVECVAAGAALRPYGVTVPTAAVGSSRDAVSPIVAGVRAASAATGEGYVLLIVRPDGLPAFYRAASALSAANVPFGYELLDADAEIAWGESNDTHVAAVDAAVQAALQNAPRRPERRPQSFPGARGEDDFLADADEPDGSFTRLPDGGRPGGGAPGDDGFDPFSPPSSNQPGFAGGPFGDRGTAEAIDRGFDPRRADLAKNFPGGTAADRLNVGGTVPASMRRSVSPPRAFRTGGSPSTGGAPTSPSSSSPPGPPSQRPAGSFESSSGTGPSEGGSDAATGPAGDSPNQSPIEAAPGEGTMQDQPFDPFEGLSSGGGAAAATDATDATEGAQGGSSDGSSAEQSAPAGGAAPGGSPGGSPNGASEGSPGGSPGRASDSPSGPPGDGRGGGASGTDNRIRFTVRTPVTLASSHLWIGGRWVELPANDDQLAAALQRELDRTLADRGDPPAGFRWSPELRLSVRQDGRRQVSRVIAAAERAGAQVQLEGARR